MKMISVIVPVYNTPLAFLEKCINSILAQSYTNFELIIIDDGSEKKCAEYLDVRAKKDHRIIVRHIQNGGVSHARNEGLDIAQGEYICFVDSDDWILSGSLEKIIQEIEKYNLDIICSVIKMPDRQNRCKVLTKDSDKMVIFEDKDINIVKNVMLSDFKGIDVGDLQLQCVGGEAGGKIYKKKIIDETRFREDLCFGEDLVFNLELLKETKRIGYTTNPFYVYRTNESSATQMYREKIENEMYSLLNKIKEIQLDINENSFYSRCIVCFNQVMRLNICHKDSQCKDKLTATKRLMNIPVYEEAFCNIDVNQFIMPNKNKLLIWFGKKKMYRGVLFLHWIRAKR